MFGMPYRSGEQIQASTHWTWEHEQLSSDEIYGKKNVVNNFCISTGFMSLAVQAAIQAMAGKTTNLISPNKRVSTVWSAMINPVNTENSLPQQVIPIMSILNGLLVSGKILPAVDLAQSAKVLRHQK